MPDLSNLCRACGVATAIDGEPWKLCEECREDVILAAQGEIRHSSDEGYVYTENGVRLRVETPEEETARAIADIKHYRKCIAELADRLTADEREEAFAGTPTAWDADGRVAEVSR